MPMVGGKKYPYTESGKAAAKKAAVKMARSGAKKKKQNWSGVKSQLSAGSGY
jgi:hypothetical protein